MLLLASDVSARAVETKLDMLRPIMAKRHRRFVEHGVEGLTNRHRSRSRWKLAAQMCTWVLVGTRRRRVAAHLGVSKNLVQRVWR